MRNISYHTYVIVTALRGPKDPIERREEILCEYCTDGYSITLYCIREHYTNRPWMFTMDTLSQVTG